MDDRRNAQKHSFPLIQNQTVGTENKAPPKKMERFSSRVKIPPFEETADRSAREFFCPAALGDPVFCG